MLQKGNMKGALYGMFCLHVLLEQVVVYFLAMTLEYQVIFFNNLILFYQFKLNQNNFKSKFII
jgi:hypothetical protein